MKADWFWCKGQLVVGLLCLSQRRPECKDRFRLRTSFAGPKSEPNRMRGARQSRSAGQGARLIWNNRRTHAIHRTKTYWLGDRIASLLSFPAQVETDQLIFTASKQETVRQRGKSSNLGGEHLSPGLWLKAVRAGQGQNEFALVGQNDQAVTCAQKGR